MDSINMLVGNAWIIASLFLEGTGSYAVFFIGIIILLAGLV